MSYRINRIHDRTLRVLKASICAALVAVIGAIPAAASAPEVLLILDASGSMWGQVEGRAKIDIAREVVRDEVVGKLPAEIPIGLMAYGHNRKGDCQDIELLAAVGTNRTSVVETSAALSPKGMTPITTALTRAGELLHSEEGRVEIVLVSDGKETCEGDPCAAARVLRESGVDLRVHVVGFDVDAEEEAQLQCIAREGGGIYAKADNAAELRDAIGELEATIVETPVAAAPAVEKKVVRRRRSKGVISVPNLGERTVRVCTMESTCFNTASDGYLGMLTADQPSIEVASGTYRLRLPYSSWGSFLDGVEVQDGETTEIQLGRIGVADLDISVAVCTPESTCYNESSDGFAGLLTPERPVIEVFAGTYKLKFGEQYEEGLVVEPGTELVIE